MEERAISIIFSLIETKFKFKPAVVNDPTMGPRRELANEPSQQPNAMFLSKTAVLSLLLSAVRASHSAILDNHTLDPDAYGERRTITTAWGVAADWPLNCVHACPLCVLTCSACSVGRRPRRRARSTNVSTRLKSSVKTTQCCPRSGRAGPVRVVLDTG